MKEEEIQDSNKSIQKELSFSSKIGYMLTLVGLISLQNSIVWAISDDVSDKWFSRMFMGVICFGFAGVIFRLRK